jgi:hypothetical protein
MGLASAKSVASWRTRGGTSEEAEVAMTLSYGCYYSRKERGELKASCNNRIMVKYTLKVRFD